MSLSFCKWISISTEILRNCLLSAEKKARILKTAVAFSDCGGAREPSIGIWWKMERYSFSSRLIMIQNSYCLKLSNIPYMSGHDDISVSCGAGWQGQASISFLLFNKNFPILQSFIPPHLLSCRSDDGPGPKLATLLYSIVDINQFVRISYLE